MSEFVSIADACELVTDGTHYTPKNVGEGVPFLTVRDVSDVGLDFVGCSFISDADFLAADAGNSAPKRGDVLFSKDGTVGKVHVVETDQRFAVLSSLAILRPKRGKVDPKYLSHVLRSPPVLDDALKKKTGSAIRRIVLGDLKRVLLPLPSLAEQRRIAAILDQAETLRAQRRAAIAQLDSLAQAIFHSAFGDPTTNSLGLKMAALDDLGDWKSGGTPPREERKYFEGAIPWFSSGELESMYVSRSEEHINELAIRDTSAKWVPAGALMLGMYDTAALKASIAGVDCACNQAIAFGVLKPRVAHVLYVYFAILIGREHFRRMQRGVRQKNLNLSMIRELRIPLPPLPLQTEFAERIAGLEQLRAAHSVALARLDELFASLQHRAFRGELTARAVRQLEPTVGLEALIFVAKRMQAERYQHYKSLKALYFADKRHLEKHGRLIYGETHCALPHGPVPQAAYDATRVLNGERLIGDFDDEALRAGLRRIKDDQQDKLVALRDADFSKLGAAERESLEWAIRYCADMSFEQVKAASHDTAYDRTPPNQPIPLAYLMDMLPTDAQDRRPPP